MKGFAFALLCVVAAAQARSADVKHAGILAAAGDNPWVVHLRFAVATGGFVESCVGSLIGSSWVLTSANCLRNARFVWVRYGAVDVFRPTLVTESGVGPITLHPSADVALISINRDVLNPPSDNIATVASVAGADDEVPTSGRFCGYGADDDDNAGQFLSCSVLSVSAQEDGSITGQQGEQEITRFDRGAPLVQDGVQYGILVQESNDDGDAVFLNVGAYRGWIEQTTGLSFGGEASEVENSEVESEVQPSEVHFV